MHVHSVKIVSGSMSRRLAVALLVIQKAESEQEDHRPHKDC
jgi:hypothetical protein